MFIVAVLVVWLIVLGPCGLAGVVDLLCRSLVLASRVVAFGYLFFV